MESNEREGREREREMKAEAETAGKINQLAGTAVLAFLLQ
jgi:hypothetical protein